VTGRCREQFGSDYINFSFDNIECSCRIDSHLIVYNFDVFEEFDDLRGTAINPDWFNRQRIQSHKINFRHRCISAGTASVDEAT
jgi:hypothetical protein